MTQENNNYTIPSGILTWGRFEPYSCSAIGKSIWRIGTIAEGSCYFHAILTACDKTYRSLESIDRPSGEIERKQYVSEVRGRLASNLTEDKWDSIQNGTPMILGFAIKLNKITNIINSTFANPQKHINSKSRSWIYTCFDCKTDTMLIVDNLLQNTHINTEITNEFYNSENYEETFVKHHLSKLIKKIEKYAKTLVKNKGEQFLKDLVQMYKTFLEQTYRHVYQDSYNHIKSNIRDPANYIGTELWYYFSDQFGVNLVVLDGDTGKPYITSTSLDPSLKIIILLAVNSKQHYECLGYQVPNTNSSKVQIQCKWDYDDPDIKEIIQAYSS